MLHEGEYLAKWLFLAKSPGRLDNARYWIGDQGILVVQFDGEGLVSSKRFA